MANDAAPLKIPPQSLEAEQSVLGSMIIDKDQIAVVLDFLKGEAFYREAHAIIFNAIIDLFNRSDPVDIVTLSEYLDSRKILEKVGGTAYLATLAEGVPTPKNAEKYAKIVEEKYLLRRLINAANTISADAYNQEGEVVNIISEAEKIVYEVSAERYGRELKPMREAVKSAYRGIEKAYQNRGKPIGLSSGFTNIDKYTGGFKGSELIILAARPGMGKTSLALNIAQRIALDDEVPVGIFSLEMGDDQLARRMISAEAEVDAFALERGMLPDSDWPRLRRAFDKLMPAPIYIVDAPGIGPTEMRAKARRMCFEFNVKFLVIDYLQLMAVQDKRVESRYAEVSEMTRQLKLMARDLNIPVMCLSQLSRKTEEGGGGRPRLSHLRDSGSIEQDADIVMFIYRDSYYKKQDSEEAAAEASDYEEAEVIIAKNRNGPTGTAKLVFRSFLTKFDDMTDRQ